MTRRRGMTPEEEALWRKAMRDVAPFPHKKPPPHTPPLVSSSRRAGPIASLPGRQAARNASSASTSTVKSPPHGGHVDTLVPHRPSHPFASGDPKMDRRAGRGRIAIDAVLDLHGHTQRTALPTLHRFVAEGHRRGARCLLVITGKGAAQSDALNSDGSAQMGRGVLRSRFRDWLADAPLRDLVSRASPAHARHGGGGAFYVFLKSRKS